jgi:alpha-beta hydrolase superfamily lysophospholipase
MIHGSGPADRDENVPGMKIGFLRAVAHRLAQAGIASFRYDKRGVGASEGDLSKAGLTDLVEDARAALEALRTRGEIDPERVFILGHSEGGNIAPLVAVGDPSVRGLILVATNARPLDQIIRRQVETLNRAAGLSESDLEAILEQQDEWAAFVKESEGDWEDYPYKQLKEPLTWLTPEKYAGLTRVSLRWLREHFTRDPLETIRRVKVPVLILQGEKDIQVPKEEAELLARVLREAGNEEVELHILPDLNHLMRRHPEEPNLQYRHLDEPVDERVLRLIVEWVRAHSKPTQY